MSTRVHAIVGHIQPRAVTSHGEDGILQGVKVVELAQVVAGPTTGALLADMGATVIKVEPPEGDSYRKMMTHPRTGKTRWGHDWGCLFEHCNRGKLSVVLDFREPADMAAMAKLLAQADVLLTNVREQGLKNLGLDYKTLHTKYPSLIYAHLTAWGLGGPDQEYPGYDAGAFMAASGLQRYVTQEQDGRTIVPQIPSGFGDTTTSVHLLAGILGALYHRQRTGEGQKVEACLYRAGIWGLGLQISQALELRSMTSGKERFPTAKTEDFWGPTFNLYVCQDGGLIQLLGLDTERHLDSVLSAVDPPGDIRSQDLFKGDIKTLVVTLLKSGPRTHFIKELSDRFLTKSTEEWEQILRKHDVWFRTCLDFNDVTNEPQANAVGAFVETGAHFPLVAHPIKFSAAPPRPRGRAPVLGAHTQQVLSPFKEEAA